MFLFDLCKKQGIKSQNVNLSVFFLSCEALPGYALKKDHNILGFRMNPQFSHIMWASGPPKTDVPLEACEFLREINGLEPENSSSKKRVGFCLQSLRQ